MNLTQTYPEARTYKGYKKLLVVIQKLQPHADPANGSFKATIGMCEGPPNAIFTKKNALTAGAIQVLNRLGNNIQEAQFLQIEVLIY